MKNSTYGNFTLGGGSFLRTNFESINKNPYHNKIISNFITVVWQDINRMKLSKKIHNMIILNVGSGREAIAFEKIGVKKIFFVDQSYQNIKNIKHYNKINNTKIVSYNLDICSKNFEKKKFKYDLAYLNGVIHHTKNIKIFLKNVKKKLSKNGVIWLYVYQAGCVYNILRYIQRQLAKINKINNTELNSFLKKKLSPVDLEKNLDDIGCENLKIYSAEKYKKIFLSMNLKVTFSKDFYANSKPSIRLNDKSFLCSLKNSGKKINYKKFKIDESDVINPSEYNKEDYSIVQKINNFYIEFIQNKIKNKKKVLKFIFLIAKLKKKYNYLSSYEEKINLLEILLKNKKILKS